MDKLKYSIFLFILLLLITPVISAVNNDVEVDNTKAESMIIINVDNITTGDIIVQVNEDATGVINVNVDGKVFSAPIDKGVATFNVDNLDEGSYDVLATYDGDENYLSSTNTSTFEVRKNPEVEKYATHISVSAKDIKEGENAIVNVMLPSDATGTVTVSVHDKSYTNQLIDGKTSVSIPGLTKGSYLVNVNYSGDNKYLPNSTHVYLDVDKKAADLPVINNAPKDNNADSVGINATTGLPILILAIALVIIVSIVILKRK
ncbi:Ig-like domain-containing protein [uncultured Methanobrevibacter sp.]|uniref:Ig-like domain-containing protein n=1 Tax=uncultured Methanobrevibacter sp. TaxID=253161 RepID=UPI002601D82C|nr:Ig-like domain-containing protein [uncultured Methanobrevibacter sp.]